MSTLNRINQETRRPAEAQPRTGAVDVAIAHAFRLLGRDPASARAQAEAILEVVPTYPAGRLALGAALLRLGEAAAARDVLAALASSHPTWGEVHHQLGLALASLRDEGAIETLRRAVALAPVLADAWGALGDELMLAGDFEGADQAYARQIRASTDDPELMRAAVAMCDGRLDVAEPILRRRLTARPTDVAAIRMLAEIGARLGEYADAENLLARCLELAPSFHAARHNYGVVLHRQGKVAEAAAQIARLLAADPHNPGYRTLQAAVLAQAGDYDRAIDAYEALLAQCPDQPKVWLSYGHALKTAGRQADSIGAYRRAIALAPRFGEAYWSLANLKTVRLGDGDVAEMSARLGERDLTDDDRLHLHYALGKALEDRADFARSFDHYQRGARIRRAQVSYAADDTTAQVSRAKAVFNHTFMASRAPMRASAPAAGPTPIFIVGLPRSGSTLIEQILSSHSRVEGTMELPEIANIVRTLRQGAPAGGRAGYLDSLADLDSDALGRLGETYLANTRIYRKTGAPFFIDKMPNNFLHVGLIDLILPGAPIIDARRHPIATCFSAFKQHFARGQHFSYDLTDLGRYYCDYVDLMAHFDRVDPGRILRVDYERLVDDVETEARRLLDYCALPFEPACLKFYENPRAVRTASSEQVRKPIFREALDQWRNFEPWLDPLKAALAPVLETTWPQGRSAIHDR
jgi:tetratricopeptide (TPR) repeat protein